MDNEFILLDRIDKIRAVNEQYDLENNAYVSFSGGKDSTVLHYLIDLALPNNKIPRVYFNTGIEYLDMVEFVKDLTSKDNRFIIVNSGVNIKKMLETEGYPFKSKQHSHNVAIYQNQENIINCDDIDFIRQQANKKDNKLDYHIPLTLVRYLGVEETSTKFRCPAKLLYQFRKDFKIKLSDKCCYHLKKQTAIKYQKESEKTITLTGMRSSEGGQRASIGCIITDKDNNLKKFHPLLVIDDEWEDWFIKKYNIKLCKLYYPPYNFKRTGCKGCPFALELQQELDAMEQLLPAEKRQCEKIWGPVYKEYRRIGYRLRKKDAQQNIFDFMGD